MSENNYVDVDDLIAARSEAAKATQNKSDDGEDATTPPAAAAAAAETPGRFVQKAPLRLDLDDELSDEKKTADDNGTTSSAAAKSPTTNMDSSDRDQKAKSRGRSTVTITQPGAVAVSASASAAEGQEQAETEADDALTQAVHRSSASRAAAERRKNRTSSSRQSSMDSSDKETSASVATTTTTKSSSSPTKSGEKPPTGKTRTSSSATKPGVQHVTSTDAAKTNPKGKSAGPGLGSRSGNRVERVAGPVPNLKASTMPAPNQQQNMVVSNVNVSTSSDTDAIIMNDDLLLQKKNAAMGAGGGGVGGTAVPQPRSSDASRGKGLRGSREQARQIQTRSEIPGGGAPSPGSNITSSKEVYINNGKVGANGSQGRDDDYNAQAKEALAQAKSDEDLFLTKSEEDPGSIIPGSIIGGSIIGSNGELIPIPDEYQPARVPTQGVSDRRLVVAAPVDEDVDEERRQDLDAAELVDPEVEAKLQEERSRRRKRCLAGFLMIGLVVIGIIVALVVVLGQGEDKIEVAVASTKPPTVAPSMAPTSQPTPYILDLPAYTLEAIENDPDSPQARAYNWLMNDPNIAEHDALREGNLLERFALATFYYSMNGDEWELKTNWLSHDHDICEWHFVGSDAWEHPCQGGDIGRAYSLIWLPDNNLRGTIPREISFLTELQGIQLDLNEEIVGSIPTEILSLPKLDDLVVHNTELMGTVATEIGLATKLRRFYFGRTRIGGQLPTEIGLLTSMIDFNGARSALIGTIPSEVGLMASLRNISFTRLVDIPDGRMGMSGTIPTEIGLLQGLKTIFFGVGGFSGTLPSQIGNLPLLEQLALYENNLEQALPTELGLLTSLEGIWVTDNLFSGSIPSEIGLLGQNENFGYMLFDQNYFSGVFPTELGLLNKTMKQMDVSDNPELSGTVPQSLCNLGSNFSFSCDAGSLCGCDCTCPANQQ